MNRFAASLLFFGMMATAVAARFGLRHFERAKAMRALASRDILTAAAIYAAYYADSGLSAKQVRKAWDKVAGLLNQEPGKLRPEDTLHSLSVSSGMVGSNLETLLAEAGDRSGKAGPDRPLETVDDAVRFLAAKAR